MNQYEKYQMYGEIKYQVSLKKYTTLRVGGIADAMIYPHDQIGRASCRERV